MTSPTYTAGLWPTRDADAHAHFAALLTRLGQPLGSRPILLAIRGVRPGDATAHETRTAVDLDDTGVLLAGDTARVFAMATHPYQLDSKASPDVDGDGRGDVACILPGRYVMRRLSPVVLHVTREDGSDRIPCLRDTRHDGRPVTPGFATSILLHADWRSGKSSIGCQTAAEADVRAVAAAGEVVDLLLVTAGELAAVAGLGEDDRRQAEAVVGATVAGLTSAGRVTDTAGETLSDMSDTQRNT